MTGYPQLAMVEQCLYIPRMHPVAQTPFLSSSILLAGLLLRPRGA